MNQSFSTLVEVSCTWGEAHVLQETFIKMVMRIFT